MFAFVAPRFEGRRPAHLSYEELQASLKSSGVLQSTRVEAAFHEVPRPAFVPAPQQDQANMDCPIRLGALGFNISAPHMHAMCLEALDICPGERVLDVGAGCGLVAAMAAFLVGPKGAVVGVDPRPEATALSRSNVAALREGNPRYASAAASDLQLATHNVFLPSKLLQGGFDKIHVGACCRRGDLPRLLALLAPGGALVTPVGDQLRLYRLRPGETCNPEFSVLSHVHFGELLVPRDAEVVLRGLQMAREQAAGSVVADSTYRADMDSVQAALGGHRPSSVGVLSGPGEASAVLQALGPTDCELVGGDGGTRWRLPAHRAVLRERCELFRAQFDSGMRDAGESVIALPPEFDAATARGFLDYLYTDHLDVPREAAMDMMQLALYTGVHRLKTLCEQSFCSVLRGGPVRAGSEPVEHAAELLRLAREHSLSGLAAESVGFIAHNFELVSKTKGYQLLDAADVTAVAAHIRATLDGCISHLRELGSYSVPTHDSDSD